MPAGMRTLLLSSVFWLLACGDPAVPVPEQVVDAACAMCIYEMEGARGCFWAVELQDTHYVVVGDTPQDHESHAPDGMCNVERQARVAGEIKDGRFYASTFALLPAAAIPDNPRYSPADQH